MGKGRPACNERRCAEPGCCWCRCCLGSLPCRRARRARVRDRAWLPGRLGWRPVGGGGGGDRYGRPAGRVPRVAGCGMEAGAGCQGAWTRGHGVGRRQTGRVWVQAWRLVVGLWRMMVCKARMQRTLRATAVPAPSMPPHASAACRCCPQPPQGRSHPRALLANCGDSDPSCFGPPLPTLSLAPHSTAVLYLTDFH
jgi:hypothetical protein